MIMWYESGMIVLWLQKLTMLQANKPQEAQDKTNAGQNPAVGNSGHKLAKKGSLT